jgi:hypothetical protein
MRVFNDFECPKGHFNEHFVDNLETKVNCLDCGVEATKVRSVPRFHLPGNDKAGFPTAYAKWERDRDQKIAQERKSNPES